MVWSYPAVARTVSDPVAASPPGESAKLLLGDRVVGELGGRTVPAVAGGGNPSPLSGLITIILIHSLTTFKTKHI